MSDNDFFYFMPKISYENEEVIIHQDSDEQEEIDEEQFLQEEMNRIII